MSATTNCPWRPPLLKCDLKNYIKIKKKQENFQITVTPPDHTSLLDHKNGREYSIQVAICLHHIDIILRMKKKLISESRLSPRNVAEGLVLIQVNFIFKTRLRACIHVPQVAKTYCRTIEVKEAMKDSGWRAVLQLQFEHELSYSSQESQDSDQTFLSLAPCSIRIKKAN
jgi:hypothetical protein